MCRSVCGVTPSSPAARACFVTRSSTPCGPSASPRWPRKSAVLADALPPQDLRDPEPFRSAAQRALGDPAFDAAWAAGRAMATRDVVDYALSDRVD